jgi:predicted amidophosphoribosyltransferase
MRAIARDLCKRPIIDATDVLERNITIDKKHISGGSRNFGEEIRSLTLRNADKILNKQVLLLDDITTTGTSLKAGKYIIMKAPPELVVMFALGKTQSDKRSIV